MTPEDSRNRTRSVINLFWHCFKPGIVLDHAEIEVKLNAVLEQYEDSPTTPDRSKDRSR